MGDGGDVFVVCAAHECVRGTIVSGIVSSAASNIGIGNW